MKLLLLTELDNHAINNVNDLVIVEKKFLNCVKEIFLSPSPTNTPNQ